MKKIFSLVAVALMSFSLTAKAETVELTSSNCEWYNYLQYSSHYWQFWGYDDTNAYQFSFYKHGGNMVDGQEVPDGTWDVSALDGKYITYADDLAEKMKLLLQDREMCYEIGKKARKWLENCCNEKVMGKNIEQYYETILVRRQE